MTIAAQPCRRSFALSLHWTGQAAVIAVLVSLCSLGAQAQEDEAEDEGPVGLSVEGVIRSTEGGIGFPDGRVMRAPPRLATGGPFECAPPAGESRSCAIGGVWDYCSLSSITFGQTDSFAESRCSVVDRGEGRWSIDVVATRKMILTCMATCLRLEIR